MTREEGGYWTFVQRFVPCCELEGSTKVCVEKAKEGTGRGKLGNINITEYRVKAYSCGVL